MFMLSIIRHGAEPGYYADGRYGIRIENIVIVRDAQTPNNFGDKGYLRFEHVTLVCPRLSFFVLIHCPLITFCRSARWARASSTRRY